MYLHQMGGVELSGSGQFVSLLAELIPNLQELPLHVDYVVIDLAA